MDKINYMVSENRKKIEIPEKLEFGHVFTEHLFEMDYSAEKGWHNPTIRNYDKIAFHPATAVFHYGQSIFEGLKAYKTVSGKIALFRPEKHIARLNNSSKKLCIPPVDPEFLLQALIELVKVEKDWVPDRKGYSLYIRPFIFGSDPFIGVHPSKTYKLFIILSPVAAYYPEGFKPVSILATDEYVRAVRKGIGDCKTSANYAASLYGAEEAQKKGFTQVLWMDGVEQKYIEEVGTMNMFVNFKNEIATPMLTGSILPGITRMTVIELLKSWGYNVNERLISMQEIIDGYKSGNVLGVFGTGTAAVISPVGKLTYKDTEMVFNGGQAGELDIKLFNEISDIQYGIKPDVHNWLMYL